MSTITLPKYQSVIENETEKAIRNKIRKDSAINTFGPIDGLLQKYQRLTGKLVIGRSQIGVGDKFTVGERFSSKKLNEFFEKIAQDLQILYAEAGTIDNYLLFLRRSLFSSIWSNTRYINSTRDRVVDFIDLDINNSFFTDIITNAFNITSNRTNSNFPATVDTESERLKLTPIRSFFWAGFFKNRVNTTVFSNGLQIVEEEDRQLVFSEDVTRPWYIALLGSKPENSAVKGIDFSEYDGAIVGMQLGFENLRAINQIKITPFSTAKLEVLAILYNNIDTPKNWNLLSINQPQSSEFVYEFNFSRVFAKEIIVVFGQREYLAINDPYVEQDTRLSVEHIALREIGKYTNNVNNYTEIGVEPQFLDTPFKNMISRIMAQIAQPTIKNPKDKLRQYLIGVSEIEVNYHEYLASGIYESETIQADGNIIEVQLQETSIINIDQNNVLNTAITHDLKIGGIEYPVAVLDTNNKIIDANLVSIDNNGNLFTFTRFLALVPTVELFYNGKKLLTTDYVVAIEPEGNGHRINITNLEVIPQDIVGMRYSAPSTEPNGLIYYPHIFNSRRRIGAPNIIISEGGFVVSEDAYIFPVLPDIVETAVSTLSGSVITIVTPTINYIVGQQIFISAGVNSIYTAIREIDDSILVSYQLTLSDVTGLTGGGVTITTGGEPNYSQPIQYSKGEFKVVTIEEKRYLEIETPKFLTSIPAQEYNYTRFYKVLPLESLPPQHLATPLTYVPEDYFIGPNRGFYFGIINEEQDIPVSRNISIGDSSSVGFDSVGGYKRDSLIIKYSGKTISGFTQYTTDSTNDIKNKQIVNISDLTIPIGATLQISYIPINSGYVSNNSNSYPLQSVNIKPPNIIETFDVLDENKSVQINNVPYIDNKIVSDLNTWDYTRGVFSLKRNVSVTYEPIKVYINNRKIDNKTDYFGGDKPILEQTTNLIETKYIVESDKIVFNRAIDDSESIRVEYYELAGEIGIVNRLYRIDGTSVELTPELFNYTLLVNVRKQ